MPAPRMISTTGSALTADEMSFAWRVFASFSVDMKRGWVKVIRRQDPATGTIVEYHADKDIAYVTPGGAVDYVTMAMPNPVPYRGVSIGVMTVGGATSTYVMASDGTVLASEVLTQSLSTNPPGSPTWPWHYDKYYFNDAFTNASAVWNGGGSVWAMQNDYSSLNGISNYTYQKTNTFDVPEDCIFPAPTVLAPIYTGDDAKTGEWNADWQAGVTVFNTRRKAWFKKNSDEFIAALKTGFSLGTPGVTRPELQLGQLPASWDYQIKAAVGSMYSTYSTDTTVGQHTKMPIIMSVTSAADVVVSDTTASGAQAGTNITKRTTTFAYTDAAGKAWSVAIDGYRTRVSTAPYAQGETSYTFEDWYVSSEREMWVYIGVSYSSVSYDSGAVDRPFINDGRVYGATDGRPWSSVFLDGGTSHYTYEGTLWSGYVPGNYRAQYYNGSVVGKTTLYGHSPDIFLQYHNTVKPVYVSDAAQASTVMNNSAMYGVTKVELTPIGLIANGVGTAAAGESVGIFSASEDGTQVEIYGTAVYNFNWQTGSLTFANWKSLHGNNGLEVGSKTVTLPQGVVWSDVGINCLVTYRGVHWPDVIRAISVRNSGIPTAVNPEDRVLGTLMDAVKAG